MEKAIMWHTFKTSQNGDIQWIWSGSWEWWAVSGVIGRWSWFYLHIYAAKYVYFWILQRRLARHWGAGAIHARLRWGYLKKYSRIELCMVDKGFGGRQYQKTTLASNPKRDYIRDVCMRDHMPQAKKARSYFYTKRFPLESFLFLSPIQWCVIKANHLYRLVVCD
jgi:hypothetical protein